MLNIPMRPTPTHVIAALALALVLGATACDDSTLPEALFENTIDTVTLYALDGTPVSTQSGYNIVGRSPVRTDLSTNFDFVFNIDTLGRALLIPAPALSMGGNAGFQAATGTFEEVRSAPTGDYISDSGYAIIPGQVVAARSRLVSCAGLGSLSYYAKIGVLVVDPTDRLVTFEILANINCGYRSLEPGRPTQ